MEGGGKEVRGGRDICIPMADSCWCLEETNTVLWSNLSSIKNKFKNLKKKMKSEKKMYDVPTMC